jgi:predicted amidohydrolase YtcJ
MFNRLREREAGTAEGQWIVARGSFGFDNTIVEKRLPTRLELDAISQRHPIVVMAGLHRVAMNTMAFKQLQLWDPDVAATLKFFDGRRRVGTDVARDAEGKPTGSATEIFDLLPTLYSIDEKREAIRAQIVPNFSAKGLTSVATIPLGREDLIVDQQLQAEDVLPLRLRYYHTVPLVTSLDTILAGELLPGAGNDMFRYGGVKVFPSGAGVDAAGKSVDDMKFTPDEFNEFVWRVHSAGQQLLIHEEGESSLAWGLNAVEKAQQRRPIPLRHRMEHSYLLDDIEEIRRLRRLGMRITTTPMQQKFAPLYPIPRYATLIREGIEPAAVSDATGTVPDFSPLTAIASIVAPQSEGGSAPTGESPTIEDAVRMWTLWAARAQFEEVDKGSIEPGKLGDFAVLSVDLEKVSGGAHFDTQVTATVLGGKLVYQRS